MKLIALVMGGMVMMSGCGLLGILKGIDEEQLVSIDEVDAIRVQLEAENLHVAATDGAGMKIRLHGRATQELRIASAIEGRTLVVGVDHLSGMRLYEDVVLELSVPRERAKNLALETATRSGNSRLESFELASFSHTSSSGRLTTGDLSARRVSLETASGSVAMKKLDAESLEMTGTSANLSIDQCSADAARVRTGSGNVTIDGSLGRAVVESRSGNVRIVYRDFERKDATITTASGSTTVELPSDAEFSLYARTSSGRIRSDFPIPGSEGPDKKEIAGQVGFKTNRVSIESSSGSVKLLKSE